MPFLGLALGGGSFPRAFKPHCSEGFEGSARAIAIEGHVGLRRGALQVETRTAYQGEFALIQDACAVVPAPGWNGVHTTRFPTTTPGAFYTSDVRLGYRLDRGEVSFLFNAGVGRVWSRGVTTVLLGGGLRGGSRLQMALDAGVVLYRLVWTVRTAEWSSGSVVREISRDEFNDWKRGVSIRIGFVFDTAGRN
jgi:hypothetical protein